ncbi:AraC family transcription regulator [Pseudomonas sp. CFII64]|jgi:transcriptional regulator GlxA family with amidase domain|nr:AraC family transcription regulator [Pseudomonas sp. CFII64]
MVRAQGAENVTQKEAPRPETGDLLTVTRRCVFDRLHLWLADNLSRSDLCVDLLARQMHMSRRNFARRYKEKTCRTPAKTIEIFRLIAARRMLENSLQNIDQIACACGFGDEERMRATFQRHLAVSPRDYRGRFGRASPQDGRAQSSG